MDRSKSVVRRLIVLGGGCVAAVALAVSGADAADCKSVSGKFDIQDASGAGCASSVAVCATLQLSGSLAGAGQLVGTSLMATVDTPTTAVVLLTADTTTTTKNGTLLTKDAIVLRTTGPGDFTGLQTVVGGIGTWAGTTGDIRISGTFISGSGGSGSYAGEVCQAG